MQPLPALVLVSVLVELVILLLLLLLLLLLVLLVVVVVVVVVVVMVVVVVTVIVVVSGLVQVLLVLLVGSVGNFGCTCHKIPVRKRSACRWTPSLTRAPLTLFLGPGLGLVLGQMKIRIQTPTSQ